MLDCMNSYFPFDFTAEYTTTTLMCCFCPLFLSARSPAGCGSSKTIHLKNVSQSQFQQEKDHLLPLHLCHRHGQHSICLSCGEGPHLARKPRGVQLGLKQWCCRGNSIGLVQLAVRRALLWFGLPHTATEHHHPKQEIEKLQSLSWNDYTTDVFPIFLLGSLKMDVSSYNEVCPDN